MDKGREGVQKPSHKTAEGYPIHHDYSQGTDQDGKRIRWVKKDKTVVLYPWEPVRTEDGGCMFRNPMTREWQSETPEAPPPEAQKQSSTPASTRQQQYQQYLQQLHLYNVTQQYQAQKAAEYNHHLQQAYKHSPRIYQTDAQAQPSARRATGTSSGPSHLNVEHVSYNRQEPRGVPTKKSSTHHKSNRHSQSPPRHLLTQAPHGGEHNDTPTDLRMEQLQICGPDDGARHEERPSQGRATGDRDGKHTKPRPAAPEAPPLGGGVGREGYRTQWLEEQKVLEEREQQVQKEREQQVPPKDPKKQVPEERKEQVPKDRQEQIKGEENFEALQRKMRAERRRKARAS